jgi:subtilisin family serine protease
MVSLRNVIIACLAAKAQAAIGRRSASTIARSYIVELDDGLDVASFYAKLAAQGISTSMRHKMDFELFKGCSFDLTNTSAANVQAAVGFISTLPAVKNVWPNRVSTGGNTNAVQTVIVNSATTTRDDARTRPSLQERQAAEDTWSSHVMTQVDRLRAEGIIGKGVKVAVVDSGIDFTHPALGGCFGPGCLVAYGHDYVDNKTEPSDCFGHGTHVAGIIAAQSNNPYNFTGVAPGVILGAYRIAGCDVGTDDSLMLIAMNQAYEDGSDIISLSSAFGSHWSEDPISMAVERIVEKGVIVVVAAGNYGTDGMFPQEGEGSPSSAHGVASIGSIVNEVVPQNLTMSFYTLDSTSNTTMESFVWKVGTQLRDGHAPWEGTYPIYAVSTSSNNTDDGCDPLPASTTSLKDVVVLARLNRNCSIGQVKQNLVDKGAQRIMFYGPGEM